MSKEDGRTYITITKTKEQAEYERQNPYPMYECPECGRVLPVAPFSWKDYNKVKKLNNNYIAISTEKIDSIHDIFYEFFLNYRHQKFIDRYQCKLCGAEWKTDPYVSTHDETSIAISERAFKS